MSYFVFCNNLFICELLRIDYIGWGREVLFFCHCFHAIMWFRFGGCFPPRGFWDKLFYFIVALPGPSL